MARTEAQKAAQSRYRARIHLEKFGPDAGDMRGRHSNHARGSASGKWAGEKLKTSHGYIAVRVPPEHPHGWGPPGLHNFLYAYEHVVVMTNHIGRPLSSNELVHHKNRDKTDNTLDNLELLTVSEHALEHSDERGRDALGRFPPLNLRARKFPGGQP